MLSVLCFLFYLSLFCARLIQKSVVCTQLDTYVLFLSLDQYLCWWTVSICHWWYDPPNIHYISTVMFYFIKFQQKYIFLYNLKILHFIKNKVNLPGIWVTYADDWQSCLGRLVYLLPKTLNSLIFQSFNYERTWWSLIQKALKLDIYGFIRIKTTIWQP